MRKVQVHRMLEDLDTGEQVQVIGHIQAPVMARDGTERTAQALIVATPGCYYKDTLEAFTQTQAVVWTSAKPTEAGWYWWRQDEDMDPEPVHLERVGDVRWGDDGTWAVDEVSGEWAKIPTPK